MDPWQSKRILVLGMTYPSYSKKYVENACTGGIEEDSKRMVRIHPVPIRYLEEEHRFKKFQWITAKVQPHDVDPRPESLRIEPNSIEAGEVISPKDQDLRRRIVEGSPHFLRSVEDLKDRWESDKTSLGTISPKELLDLEVVEAPPGERDEWIQQEKALFAQTTMGFERPPKRLDFPDLHFVVRWVCDDPRCQGHRMKLLQWGLHELARKLKRDPDRKAKLREAMKRELNLEDRDVFLFLGNYRTKMFNFGLMDSFSPTKQDQLSLF